MRAAKRWLIEAAHVENGWWLVAPFGILGVGCSLISLADMLSR